MKTEDEFIQYNSLSTDQLFEIYKLLHFIYPAKMEHLSPVFLTVKENWEKAMKLNFPLFWVSTVKNNQDNIISTGTAWQYFNRGMIAQHLCSNHPVGSRMIFLGMLNKIINNQHTGFIESYQVFYQPQNKYSSKLFESQSLKAGREFSDIIPYHYLEVPFINSECPGNIQLSEINGYDPDFISFMTSQRSEIFLQSQELNEGDITLQNLNERLKLHGLKRTRRIFIARTNGSRKIYGAIVINDSSLGLNFSFFENSCELILCKETNLALLLNIARKLLSKATQIHAASALSYLPVLINPIHARLIEELDGKVTRNYNLFIMLKGGYKKCYEQVDQLTYQIFKRYTVHSNEKYN